MSEPRHRFTKGARDWACPMLVMLASRLEEHQKAHGGRNPQFFVLHRPSIAQLEREMLARFGAVERTYMTLPGQHEPKWHPTFMGVLIGECVVAAEQCQDQYIDVYGRDQPV